MRVIKVRNVSEAWARLPEVLVDAERQESRAGKVLVCPEPVATVYGRPTERVLFDARRDCNPFFHLIEALWMLAGRDDAATLNHYVKDFGARFGDGPAENRFIHGAYGRRWRSALGYDQLDVIVDKLRSNPQDRQAVLQMWDGVETFVHESSALGFNDLKGEWRDRPCNTHVYFRVRESRSLLGETDGPVLDMTVCCRSNDVVFGGYGANAVHFSVLQEYLAARIGVVVGTYTQISNNFHVYEDVWNVKQPRDDHSTTLGCAPMFEVPSEIDADLRLFMKQHELLWKGEMPCRSSVTYANPWFNLTASRVAFAWHYYRACSMPWSAMAMARAIGCQAWRVACMDWLDRRLHELAGA